MGNGCWALGNGYGALGNGYAALGGGRWAVGHWGVGALGHWALGIGRWGIGQWAMGIRALGVGALGNGHRAIGLAAARDEYRDARALRQRERRASGADEDRGRLDEDEAGDPGEYRRPLVDAQPWVE